MAEINLYFILICSIGLDLLIGDPEFLLHPVELIGIYIKQTSNFVVNYFAKNKYVLLCSGFFISFSAIAVSFLVGKFIEIQIFESKVSFIYSIILLFSLSSCIATKGLISSAKEISNLIKNNSEEGISLLPIKQRVQRIVSRDVSKSNKSDLLRSATESLTENSVDGIFGPLFWIFIGSILLKYSIYYPGPLALGFSYKAISTLDSMIGYKYGAFKYLGLCSAKIEDYATFLPCRLVVITLPIVSRKITNYLSIINKVFTEGGKYESPNAGISEAAFAYIVNIKLGGENLYPDGTSLKPILNINGNECNHIAIEEICNLIIRLELVWTIFFSFFFLKLN